jgi:peptidoglycan L-alanyl-D-glutamate endopeptidase CwlK
MPNKLDAKSVAKLNHVHPDLVKVVTKAIETCPQRIIVTEGLRSYSRQLELYAQGRTKPGNIVTSTLASRHLPGADGLGKAVDLAPISNGVIDWNNANAFRLIGKHMMNAAMDLEVFIRWGWDWNRNGILQERGEWDGPHFELLKSKYP